MRVILDESPLEGAPGLLGEALSLGAKEAEVRGRIIIGVSADGARVPDEMLSSPGEVGAEIRVLALSTADPHELIRETMVEAAEALEGARADQREVRDLIGKGLTAEAFESLKRALTTWQSVRDAFDRAAQVLAVRAPEDARAGAVLRQAGDDVQALSRALEEVRRAAGAQDWSALADVVGVELEALAVRWRARLVALGGG